MIKRLILTSSLLMAGVVHAEEAVIREVLSQRQMECIAHAMYHETRGNVEQYQLSIGHVIINRVLRSGKKPCRIIAKKGQFPWYAERGLNAKLPEEFYDLAFSLMIGRLTGTMPDFTNGATHFNQSRWGHQPNWTRIFPKTYVLPKMNFYKEPLTKGNKNGF